MRRIILLFIIATSAFCQTDIPWYSPWGVAKADNIDLSYLNSPILDENGFVTTQDGHTVYMGEPIRFWGTCLNKNAAFPTHGAADSLAVELAGNGVNIVRFHNILNNYYPQGLWKNIGSKTVFDSTALDHLFYLIYAFKTHGIFIEIEPHVNQKFTEAENCTTSNIDSDLGVTNFDPLRQARIKELTRTLLTTVSPYTGVALINDPVLALIVCDNESSFIEKWQNDVIDALPGYYFSAVLDTQWYDWLVAKYETTEALRLAWGCDDFPEPIDIITNGDFDEDVSSWTGGFTPAEGTLTWNETGDPNGGGCADLEITALNGASSYQVYLNQNTGQNISANVPYLLTYYVKSTEASWLHNATFTSGNLDGRSTVAGQGSTREATTDWQLMTYTFWGWETKTAVSFRMARLGRYVGTIEFDSISIVPAMPSEYIAVTLDDVSGVFRPTRMQVRWHEVSHQVCRDYLDFVHWIDCNYYSTMYSFLRDTLGVHALIGATQANNTAFIPDMDFLSQHGMTYGWFSDATNKFHKKSVLTIMKDNTVEYSTRYRHYVHRLSHIRSNSKPMILDEMAGVLAPNPWAETDILAAVYGCLQGIPGIIQYACASVELNYGTNIDWKRQYYLYNGYHNKTSSDFHVHPTRTAGMALAALIFREGLVSPSTDTVRVHVKYEDYREKGIPNVSFVQWADYPSPFDSFTHACKRIPAEVCLSRRVEFEVGASTYVEGDISVASADSFLSSTGEILWYNPDADSGILIVNTPRLKLVMGDIAGQSFQLGNVNISVESPAHCLVAVVSKGDEIKSPGHWDALVVAYGGFANTGQVDSLGLDGYYYLTNGGTAPTLIEGVNATITMPYGKTFYGNVASLDSTGSEENLFSKTKPFVLHLDKSYGTMWYSIKYDSTPRMTFRKP